MQTEYRYLTNDELINLLAIRRHLSPIVDELCTRLEAVPPEPDTNDSVTRVWCPVCEAPLMVTVNETDSSCKLEPLR